MEYANAQYKFGTLHSLEQKSSQFARNSLLSCLFRMLSVRCLPNLLSQSLKTSRKVAEAPFNDLEADMILESSDEAHFSVFKKILTLASPIFAARFSALPPPHQKFHDVRILRLVPFPDPSTIFDLALRHIYPVRTPKTDTFHNASVLAEFVRKYKVAREALDNFIAG